MAEENALNDLPHATVVRQKHFRVSVVWIIPILAAVVALGIAIQRIRNSGPSINIVVKSASGIEAGKTLIKYKDVTIGHVAKIPIPPRSSGGRERRKIVANRTPLYRLTDSTKKENSKT